MPDAKASIASGAPARHYYALSLDLAGRRTVVVGGGAVAAEKVEGLLAACSRVRVIAPTLCPALQAHAEHGVIEHLARAYRDDDLEGAFLVFAERDDPNASRAILEECERRQIFCNVQDDVPFCSAIAPSILRRGELTVAISTSGAAPAYAVRLRQRLERELGPEVADFLALARRLRRPLAEAVPDFATRKQRWYQLVDSNVLALLAAGDRVEAERIATTIMGVAPDPE